MTNEERKKKYIAQGLGVGMAIGVLFGLALDNIGLGIALGLCLGAAYGDQRAKKENAKNGDGED